MKRNQRNGIITLGLAWAAVGIGANLFGLSNFGNLILGIGAGVAITGYVAVSPKTNKGEG